SKTQSLFKLLQKGMKGLPSAAPSSPLKMIIIIVNGIVYFLEVPKNYYAADKFCLSWYRL
ncbi:hypothetical protein, partial [Nostoc sp. NMS8]|uniref:hypothetical protein n=1 Tax=Nostoc sp. NMS8 TaxID=2815392 RepID=UPI00260133FA